jgi:hypothetical protein
MLRTYVRLSIYVSGSAYKLANKRSYHHGTMLISTKLEDLGELLQPQEVCRSSFRLLAFLLREQIFPIAVVLTHP